jgi:hypothetical protein
VRSTSRSGYREPQQVRVLHSSVCYVLRLVLRTQSHSELCQHHAEARFPFTVAFWPVLSILRFLDAP